MTAPAPAPSPLAAASPTTQGGVGGYISIFKPNLFQDQVVLVTGGGTGIGRCIAHELASLGAKVVLAARKRHQLENVQNEIRTVGGICDLVVEVNIRDAEACQKGVEEVLKVYGRLDCLVNNAGGQFMSPANMLSPKGWATVVDLNLNGTFNMCKAAFDGYMGEHGGKIVNIVAETRNGVPRAIHTGAARAGIINMTKTLAVEWGPYNGIRVNCIAPGLIVSSGMKNYHESMVDMLAETSWMNPSGRFGTESEISAGVVFLLSPAASYINGVNLEIDGASSLSKGNPEGDAMKYNPDECLNPAFVGWPQDQQGQEVIQKEVDAPVLMARLLEKYKRIGRRGGVSKI